MRSQKWILLKDSQLEEVTWPKYVLKNISLMRVKFVKVFVPSLKYALYGKLWVWIGLDVMKYDGPSMGLSEYAIGRAQTMQCMVAPSKSQSDNFMCSLNVSKGCDVKRIHSQYEGLTLKRPKRQDKLQRARRSLNGLVLCPKCRKEKRWMRDA